MHSVLDYLSAVVTPAGDLVFAALGVISPAVALIIISAVVGWLMLLIWRYTSNQKAIKAARNQISAHLLSTRLFKDNLAVTFRAQRMIVWHAIRLLGYSLKPMVIMLVPFVILMAQIGLRYELQPASRGDVIRVTATLKAGNSVEETLARLMGPGSALALPAGVSADKHDPCRAEPLRTVDWRLRAEAAGSYMLTFGESGESVTMPLLVDTGFGRISSLRGGHWLDRLLYSAEPSIPAGSPFESIRVHYEARSTPILGFNLHWLVTLFVLSIIFALIFKPFMKVHI